MSPISDTAANVSNGIQDSPPLIHQLDRSLSLSQNNILDVLQKIPILNELNPAHFNALVAIAQFVKVEKGTTLITEGQLQHGFYIITKGELLVLQSNQPRMNLTAEDTFGFRNLFQESRSPYTIVCHDLACFLIEIDRKDFNHLICKDPTIALALLPNLAKYVPDTTEFHKLVTSKSSESLVGKLAWPSHMSEIRIKFFDAKPYQNQLFTLQNKGFGFHLDFIQEKLNDETVHLAKGAHAVCTFVHDSVDKQVVTALCNLGVQLVVYRCAGFDNCDIDSCDAMGLSVARVPGYSPNAIAEHAVALMMALNRKLIWANSRVHNADFSLDGLVGFDMKSKTIGIIGTGRIGVCLVSIMLGFGCKVVCFDKFKNPMLHANPVIQYVSLDQLYSQSDIISIHAPLIPETHHLIDATSIGKMKRGVMLINTSRGPLVDTHALIEALKCGQVGSCGLDVVEGENDYFFENKSQSVITNDDIAHLLSFQNRVLITAHQAFLTTEALGEIALVTLQNVAEFHSGKRLKQLSNSINKVNP